MISFHVLLVLIKSKKRENAKYVLALDTLWVHIQWSSSHKISLTRKSPTWENNNNKSNKTVALAITTVQTVIISTNEHQSNTPYHLQSHPYPLQITLTRHWQIATFSTREVKANKINPLCIKDIIAICVILSLSRGIDITVKFVKTLICALNVTTKLFINMISVFLNNLKNNKSNSDPQMVGWNPPLLH